MQRMGSTSLAFRVQICRYAALAMGVGVAFGGTAQAETTFPATHGAAALKPDAQSLTLPQKQGKPLAKANTAQSHAAQSHAAQSHAAQNRVPSASSLPQGAIAQDVGLEDEGESIGPYVGLSVNVGIAEGSTDVGQAGGALFSRIPLGEPISLRPAILIGDDVTFLIPVTADAAPFEVFEDFTIAPYAGGGLAIATTEEDSFNALLTAGIDIPISRSWVGNINANLTLINAIDFGIMFGIAYRF